MSEVVETFESFDDGDSDGMETFDDIDVIPEEEEEIVEDEREKIKDDLKPLKDTKVDMDGKVVKEDSDEKEEKPKKEKKDKTFEEEDSEEEESEEVEEKSESEEDEDKKPKSKLRMRMGEELFNVESNATFKVKVDGENVDVPVQELINNYSGKTAWDKKFTEIGKEKKTLESERGQLTKQADNLRHHMAKALEPLKDPNKNPMDSLLYLVEMSGEDPYTAYRRMMENNLEELGSLLDMTEVERELHFHKKKDELHSAVDRKRQEKQTTEQAFNQAIQKVDSLRQAHNVTEEQFVESSEELEELYKNSGLDVNSITEENIVDYASLRPHIETVKTLIEPYEDNISEGKYGDVVSKLSRHLRDGNTDMEEIKKLLKRNYSVEEDVKELNTKVYQNQQVKTAKRGKFKEDVSNINETFDDF